MFTIRPRAMDASDENNNPGELGQRNSPSKVFINQEDDDAPKLLSTLPITGFIKCSLFDEYERLFLVSETDRTGSRELTQYRLKNDGFHLCPATFRAWNITSIALTDAHGLVVCGQVNASDYCSILSLGDELERKKTFDTSLIRPKMVWWYIAGSGSTVVAAARANSILYLYEDGSVTCTRQVDYQGLQDVCQMYLRGSLLAVGLQSSHKVQFIHLETKKEHPIEVEAFRGKFAIIWRKNRMLTVGKNGGHQVIVNSLDFNQPGEGHDLLEVVSAPVAVLTSDIVAVSVQRENIAFYSLPLTLPL